MIFLLKTRWEFDRLLLMSIHLLPYVQRMTNEVYREDILVIIGSRGLIVLLDWLTKENFLDVPGDLVMIESASDAAEPLLEPAWLSLGCELSLVALPLGWRRVIPPRSFRISSTLWRPSGALGFFSLM